jgi:hypothetical protein
MGDIAFVATDSSQTIAFRCTAWLGRLVNSKALAIIQHGGLEDVARTLQPIAHFIPYLIASSASLSSAAATSEMQSSTNALQSLSDDAKLQIFRTKARFMIMFHSSASPPPESSYADDASIISLIKSCCLSCCRVTSRALEIAIASKVAVRTWNHASAVQLCIALLSTSNTDADVTSACAAVIGELLSCSS